MEFYHIFDFVLMAKILVGFVAAKQVKNHSDLQQQIFLFLAHISIG